ncbi:MAG: hypothetical protein JKP96_06650 [Oceanicaulis sp.]|jgi:hypothetical protein|nr:hypothetical protein [Oceanicaulis sp.]
MNTKTVTSAAPSKAEQLANTKAELKRVRAELDALKLRLATEAPQVLEDSKPNLRTDYDETCPQAVLAMADLGLTESEWIAEFGITRAIFDAWKGRYPQFEQAVQVARARVKAYLNRMLRQSIEHGRANVPTQVIQRLEREHGSEGAAGDDEDANRFVVLDLRMPCAECLSRKTDTQSAAPSP